MHATRPSLLLVAALVTAVESVADFVSPIVSLPASLSTESAELDAYLSTVLTESAYRAATSHYPEFAFPDGGGLRNLGKDGVNPATASSYSNLPSAVLDFISSVASVERSIYQTTVPDAAASSAQSSFQAEILSMNSYASQLHADPAYSSFMSLFPVGPGLLLNLLDYAPLFDQFGGGLPDNVKAFVSSVISRQNLIEQATVTKVYVSGDGIAFPSTTISEGIYALTPTATTGASVQGSGPAATKTSSSASTGAAPTALGCGGSCSVMLGAALGVALGAVAL